MSIVKPFRGLRPPKDKVLKVACPPYDVVNTDEARAYAAGNPLSFFHISRPEIDFEPKHDPHADDVYARGREALARFRADGVLTLDREPCYYVYRQKMGDHVQIGLCAGASTAEYDQDLILKHELTRKDKEDDRTRHIDELGGNDEPVFLLYPARPAIDALIAAVAATPPEYDFTTEDGIVHTFWVVADAARRDAIAREFAQVAKLYVADGHHRSAAASRTAAARKARNPGHTGGEEYNSFLAVIFPHDQMRIMDYNRVVLDLNGLTKEQFLARLGEKFEVQPTTDRQPRGVHEYGMFLDGAWYRLRAKAGTFDPKDPIGVLDVSILQRNALAPILGIEDPRTDKRIDFVGGIRGLGELEKRVAAGAAVAFAMYPTTIEQLMAIADAGQIMPPKSTWFEPKLRSGLVLHPFE
ncbi:MAG TPA: DUF1015 family protein [Polyangia bacterium]|jgi:uncharacterized protein (DUF1015 family)